MTSLLTSTRQVSTDAGYYIPVGNCKGLIYAYNPTAGVSTFSSAVWATTNHSTAFYVSSAGAGILRDQGRTIVSSGRTFRKVQLLISTPNTFGVGGLNPSSGYGGEDYLTGYIELGLGGAAPGAVAPVAHYGR
jgi:hypothetical protein